MRRITVFFGYAIALALIMFGFPIFVFCQEVVKDNDPHMTGLIRPTEEARTNELKTLLKVKKVHLNKLGFERVNTHRVKKGMFKLEKNTSVPISGEIEAVVGETEMPAAAADSNLSVADSLPPGSLPSYIDNSQLKYFPPIRSQGSLGSCASWAGAYYAMTHMYAFARDLDAKNGGDAYRFSPKWTYNMLNGGANVGTWHYDCYKIGIKHGCATWQEFPYDTDYRSWCLNPAVWRQAISRRFQQYGYVGSVNTDAGLAQVKQLLVNGYVLNFATYINSWQFKTIGNDPATTADDAFVGKQSAVLVNGTNGGHAMTIVGYNDDIWVDLNGDNLVTPNEKGAFRIANSWGTGWGEAGFCWLSYQAVRTRNLVSSSEGIFWYDEACWVTARPAYTPQLIVEFTLNHLKRNQLQISLGVSDVGKVTPTTTWYSQMLNYQGGPYAFDGTTVARDATFALDFTDLLPTDGSLKRYYLGVYDSKIADLAILKANKIVDLNNGAEVIAADVPKTADASQVYSFLDYQYGSPVILPAAVMSASPVSGYAPLTVTFDGTSSYSSGGSIFAYNWDFGDGTSGVGASVTHTYANYGIFTASLSVTDNHGFTSNPSATMTIAAQDNNQPPVAIANVSPLSGNAPLLVSFSGSGSYNPDGTIASYSWDFGDGVKASGVSLNHIYTTAGFFTAKLVVSDNKGLAASDIVGVNVAPDPDLIASPSNLSGVCARGIVTLLWKDNSANEGGFYVERAVKTQSGPGTYQIIVTTGANVTSFSDKVVSGTYYYRVKAFNLSTKKDSGYSNVLQIRVVAK